MKQTSMKDTVKDFYWNYNGRKLALGVGCAWLGLTSPYEAVVDADRELLMMCYKAGLRYYDTSRTYGESELSVGAFIKEIDRDSIFLATKSKLLIPGGFDTFKRNFYESFKRLNTDYIDLYQIHDTNRYDVCVNEAIPFLIERKNEGMIRYLGLATRSLVAHSRAIADGYVDSVLSYLDYNLAKKSALGVMKMARNHNVTFINASVLMFGLLKSDKSSDAEFNSLMQGSKQVNYINRLKDLCDDLKINIIEASIQYSLLNPDVDITLNGIKRPGNLESTISAIEHPLYPEQWAAIEALQRTCPSINIMDEYIE